MLQVDDQPAAFKPTFFKCPNIKIPTIIPQNIRWLYVSVVCITKVPGPYQRHWSPEDQPEGLGFRVLSFGFRLGLVPTGRAV